MQMLLVRHPIFVTDQQRPHARAHEPVKIVVGQRDRARAEEQRPAALAVEEEIEIGLPGADQRLHGDRHELFNGLFGSHCPHPSRG